jgi:hypothetical protein
MENNSMGLDAWVNCNCLEWGKSIAPPKPEWEISLFCPIRAAVSSPGWNEADVFICAVEPRVDVPPFSAYLK